MIDQLANDQELQEVQLSSNFKIKILRIKKLSSLIYKVIRNHLFRGGV